MDRCIGTQAEEALFRVLFSRERKEKRTRALLLPSTGMLRPYVGWIYEGC